MNPNEAKTETILPDHRANGPQKSQRVPTAAAQARTARTTEALQPNASNPSETELVIGTFMERIQDVDEILAVRAHGSKNLADQSFVIEVADLRSTAADKVYSLRRDLLRAHPDARLDVRVSAVRHETSAPAPDTTTEHL